MTTARPPWEDAATNATVQHFDEITDAEYHAEPYGDSMSSHKLLDFMRDPAIYWAYREGVLVDEDKPHYAFGRAAHCYILEGSENFDDRYHVSDGPINEKTGRPFGRDTQKFAAFLEEVRQDGREFVTVDEKRSIEAMYWSAVGHTVARNLFNVGAPEVVIRGTENGVALKGRLDWLDSAHGRIVDLKTCDDLDRFAKTVFEYGYNIQAAFYRRLVRLLTGHNYGVYVVAVEKKQPFRTGVWEFAQTTLYDADEKIGELLADFRNRFHIGNWSSKYDTLSVI